jgi:hypothetical protein
MNIDLPGNRLLAGPGRHWCMQLRKLPTPCPLTDLVISGMSISAPRLTSICRSSTHARLFGGRFFAHGGERHIMEGDLPDGDTILLEFLDMSKARGWYKSPA